MRKYKITIKAEIKNKIVTYSEIKQIQFLEDLYHNADIMYELIKLLAFKLDCTFENIVEITFEQLPITWEEISEME